MKRCPVLYGTKVKTSVSKTSCSITSHSRTSSNDPIVLDKNLNLVICEED